MENMAKHGTRLPGQEGVPTPGSVADHVWMWHLGTQFSGGQGGGAGLMVGFNDPKCPS